MPTILRAKNTGSKKIGALSDLHRESNKQKDTGLNGTSREKLLLVALGFIINWRKLFTGFEPTLSHF